LSKIIQTIIFEYFLEVESEEYFNTYQGYFRLLSNSRVCIACSVAALHTLQRDEIKIMPAVSFIDAIPNHVSVEEHRALTGATPTSFSDIPPVLRQKVDNVRLTFDPTPDGLSPEDGANGTLYIIERFLIPFPFF